METSTVGKDLKLIALSSVGGILEAFDFVIYLMMSKYLADKFFIGSEFNRLIWTYSVLAIGYFARPVGGLILGHFGDRYGRKSVFLVSIFVMAVATFCIGLIPEYGEIGIFAPAILIFFRLLQGLSLGGEVPGAIVFIHEHIRSDKKIFGQAILIAGIFVGVLMASVTASVVSMVLTSSRMDLFGWRIPFLLGGVFGVFGFVMRMNMTETPAFIELRHEKQILSMPMLDIIIGHKACFATAFFLILSIDTVATFFYSIFPGFLMSVCKYKSLDTFLISSINIAVFILFLLIVGFFRKSLFKGIGAYIVFFILIMLSSFSIMYFVIGSKFLLLVLSFGAMSLFVSMLQPELMIILADLFPPKVRYSGAATSYNIASAIVGGVTPLAVTWLYFNTQSYLAPSCYMGFVCLIGVVSILFMPLCKKNIAKKEVITNPFHPEYYKR